MNSRIPAPAVVVLVGPSSAGKSTWAQANFADNEVVSSDSLRAMVGIDDNDRAAGTAAFEALDLIVSERIRRQLTTVIDSLGIDPKLRAGWVEKARAGELPVFAVVFRTPLDVCLARNGQRTRPLPRSVIQKQHRSTTEVIPGLANEGFDGIVDGATAIQAVAPQFVGSTPRTTPPQNGGHTFGLLVSRFNWGGKDLGQSIASIARRAEAVGFRDFWVMDHFRQIRQVGREWEDIPEAYTTLAFVAAQTNTIRLGTLVTGITHRNPALLGKMIATLDVISGGRANAGLGLAWDTAEHAAYGIPFPSTPHRYELLEEAVRVLRLTWGKGNPEFHGRHIDANSLIAYPRPAQEHIPILIGGSGEKRTLRMVAEHADAANVFGTPERVAHKVAVLQSHCSDISRDIEEIEVTHLVNAMPDADPTMLRERVGSVRPNGVTHEQCMARNNAGPTQELGGLFARYHEAGATHSIVSIPDVDVEGSIEAFEHLIAGPG